MAGVRANVDEGENSACPPSPSSLEEEEMDDDPKLGLTQVAIFRVERKFSYSTVNAMSA